jgi:hypothetical protein
MNPEAACHHMRGASIRGQHRLSNTKSKSTKQDMKILIEGESAGFSYQASVADMSSGVVYGQMRGLVAGIHSKKRHPQSSLCHKPMIIYHSVAGFVPARRRLYHCAHTQYHSQIYCQDHHKRGKVQVFAVKGMKDNISLRTLIDMHRHGYLPRTRHLGYNLFS